MRRSSSIRSRNLPMTASSAGCEVNNPTSCSVGGARQYKRTARRSKAGGYRYGTLAETGAFTSNRLDSPPFTAKRFRSISHTQTPAARGADATAPPRGGRGRGLRDQRRDLQERRGRAPRRAEARDDVAHLLRAAGRGGPGRRPVRAGLPYRRDSTKDWTLTFSCSIEPGVASASSLRWGS